MTAVARRSVNVIMLGRMGFIPAFDIQSRYAKQHLDQMAGHPTARGEDTLLLVEHNPAYTVGVRNKDYTQEDVTRLKATGAQFYTTNRGGLITFHGPGQLVAYPILNLTRFKPSMRWYVGQLEQTLLETLKRFGLTGRLTDQTGVWVKDRKIASIGLHGSRYVTTHGIALNCITDLSWFKAIEPCGLKGVEMTSLSKELNIDVPVQEATKPFLKAFGDVFDCDLEFRMLDKEDLKVLNNAGVPPTDGNGSPSPNNTPESGGGGGGGGQKTDQVVEMGVRQMSTLSTSSSTSSSSSLSYFSSSPLSSSSHFILHKDSVATNNQNAAEMTPNMGKRMLPMW